MSTHKTLRGAEGPKTSIFVIFGQVLKDPKTGILTMVENCTGGKVQKWPFCKVLKILNLSLNSFPCKKKFWFICKKINFHSIFDLSLIFYRLQLPCLDQIEEDFRIITLHFLLG